MALDSYRELMAERSCGSPPLCFAAFNAKTQFHEISRSNHQCQTRLIRASHYLQRRQALGSEERARTMLEDVDINHDGQISFDEFSQMMRRL